MTASIVNRHRILLAAILVTSVVLFWFVFGISDFPDPLLIILSLVVIFASVVGLRRPRPYQRIILLTLIPIQILYEVSYIISAYRAKSYWKDPLLSKGGIRDAEARVFLAIVCLVVDLAVLYSLFRKRVWLQSR